jgi:uncharacterized membrane protein YdjX (TVP38/TMEM64 family)
VWWLLLLGVVAVCGIAIGLGMGWISIGERATEGWRLLLIGEPTGLRDWLLDFGIWAPIASGLLQILSSLIPFLPGFVLSIANAMLYGALLGGLLTFSTSLLAAATCFAIARVAGRTAVERIVPPLALARVNRFVDHNGGWAVFWGRLLPFINPDVVSYAAGLTRLGWVRFLGAMAAGAVPATIFYSVLGAAAVEVAPGAILLVTAATLLPLLALFFLRRRVFSSGGSEDGTKKEG